MNDLLPYSFDMDILDNKPEFLTTGEAAKICGVNFRTVSRWIQRGLLPALRLPGRGDQRIRMADFEQFLHENQMGHLLSSVPEVPSVLVCDDDVTFCRTMAQALKISGFDVAVAHNGFDAGIQMTVCHPVLVALDLRMPEMNGFEVIRRMKQLEALRSIKILVMSGEADEELLKAVELGADATLKKPFSKSQLVEEVNRLLNRPGTQSQVTVNR